MYLFVGIGGACVIIACSISVVKFSTMPRPYSNDLRWRMIYQRYFYNRSYEDIASQLFVCSKTVYRTVRTFLNTGDVKPCRLGRPTGSITLFPHEEYIIMDCILRNPQMQLHEVADNIANVTGSAFGPETLCRALYRLGITRKKIQRVALQQNENLRQQFKAEISVFSPNQLVFVDETGIDKRITRQYGYSARGTRPVVRDYSYARWAPHYSAISAISSDGLIANQLMKNPEERFNANSFIQFLNEQLLPAMNPFNGENPRSVIVMDNHAVHHVQEVIERVYDYGAIIRFLAPYSPDLNPIEEVFANVKHYLRQNHLVLHSLQDPSPLIWNAYGQITSNDCLGYMHHAGYI